MIDGSRKYRNLFQGLYVIGKEEGFRRGIMKGLSASCLRESSYSSLRLGLYEPIKRNMGATDPKTTPMWKKFVSGALAGLIGSGICNPADLLKTRMQAAPPGEYHSLKWHMQDVYNHPTQGGFVGFYRGVGPTMVRATLLGAAYLGSYDSTKYFIINNGYMEDNI